MARQGVALPQPQAFKTWQDWGVGLLQKLIEAVNRTQKYDEEFEPPVTTPTSGSRIVLRDTNGIRYAVTVSAAGALVVTSLP